MNLVHLVQNHVKQMCNIQNSFQFFVDENTNEDDTLDEILQDLTKFNILDYHHKIVSFLRYISILSNNHYRDPELFNKIEHLFAQIKDQIVQHLTNYEIFSIFKKNKLLLLYLFDLNIIIPDKDIALTITFEKYQRRNYPEFFWPEFKIFFSKELNDKIKHELNEKGIDEETLKQNRKIGQNDQFICQLIREDSIVDFIQLVNKKNIPLSMEIESSIFETHPLLMKRKASLIEYCAFFGSFQIFQYLFRNDVHIEQSIWFYAVHSLKSEIIYFLEYEEIPHPQYKYNYCEKKCEYNAIIKEAIKCHHNAIVKYLINYHIQNQLELTETYLKSLKYYNYEFYHKDVLKYDFASLMKLKNTALCQIFMKAKYIDLNRGIKIKNKNYVKIEKTPLMQAIEMNYVEFVQLLIPNKQLKVNCNIMIHNGSNTIEMNALSYAAQQSNSEIFQFLLKRKDINVNIESKCIENSKINENNTKTPLEYAVEVNNSDIVKMLMSRKDIKVKNNISDGEYSKSLLFLAVEHENVDIVRSLLSNPNIDVNLGERADSYYKTPLFLAVEKENKAIVQLLLSNEKIDVNCMSYFEQNDNNNMHLIFNKTALHEAVLRNNFEIVQLLLSKDNIDINIILNFVENRILENNGYHINGHTTVNNNALLIATKNNYISIAKLLQEKCIQSEFKKMNDYFIYDYIDQRVFPDNYTITASTSKNISGYYTKSWLIEGSNDNETWETIDEVISSNLPIEKDSTYTIPIFKKNHHKYRYIRLSATSVYDPNNCYLSIDSLDLLITNK